jgi:PLP dependent protein
MIVDNFKYVNERISETALSAGRNPDEVRLVVVTKGQSIEAVREVVQSGARYLGENYLEEAIAKIHTISEYAGVEWHMIGHIQSRKAGRVCEAFDWIQSLDSQKLAERLDRFAGELNRRIPTLLECNMSGEASKFGWETWNETRWPELIEEFACVLERPNLDIRGLMTMPPYHPDPEASRPFFRRLVRLRDYLVSQFPRVELDQLSMGMSADYPVAIQEGATIVRVGTAVMGTRTS